MKGPWGGRLGAPRKFPSAPLHTAPGKPSRISWSKKDALGPNTWIMTGIVKLCCQRDTMQLKENKTGTRARPSHPSPAHPPHPPARVLPGHGCAAGTSCPSIVLLPSKSQRGRGARGESSRRAKKGSGSRELRGEALTEIPLIVSGGGKAAQEQGQRERSGTHQPHNHC